MSPSRDPILTQHIEFFHQDHFEQNYHRVPPPPSLAHLIDFFWETKFDHLWEMYPRGFSDAQFPNIGYTYIINLGTPFTMQVTEKKFLVRRDCFLPRYNAIECYHRTGNHLFGIKFRTSPVIYEKRVDFSEYREYIFPLSYLLDPQVIENVKKCRGFDQRTDLLSTYFKSLLKKYEGSLHPVNIVTSILNKCFQENNFSVSLEQLSAQHRITPRTLQRYFEKCTGINGKQALQVMRIRKATDHLLRSPGDFHYSLYGYYDHSHFYKHLRQFLRTNTLKNLQPHLELLGLLHKSSRHENM